MLGTSVLQGEEEDFHAGLVGVRLLGPYGALQWPRAPTVTAQNTQ